MSGAPGERLAALAHFMERQIPFNRHLGLRVVRLESGVAVLMIPWQEWMVGDPSRPAVHGGVLSSLIDTAGGAACFSAFETPHDRTSTIDLRVDYLRPGPATDLYCEARVLRLGKKVAAVHMEVFPGGVPDPGSPARGEPIAVGQGVYNVLRRAPKAPHSPPTGENV